MRIAFLTTLHLFVLFGCSSRHQDYSIEDAIKGVSKLELACIRTSGTIKSKIRFPKNESNNLAGLYEYFSSTAGVTAVKSILDSNNTFVPVHATGQNGQYSFRLERRKDKKLWAIVGIATNQDKNAKEFFWKSSRKIFKAAQSLSILDSSYLHDLLTSESFRVLSIRTEANGDIEIIFDNEHKLGEGGAPIQRGVMRLVPKAMWALRSAEVDCLFYGENGDRWLKHTTSNTFEVASDGFPLLKDSVRKDFDGDTLVVESVYRAELTRKNSKNTAIHRLTYFDLLEPPSLGEPFFKAWYFFAFGFVLLIVGVVIRKKFSTR